MKIREPYDSQSMSYVYEFHGDIMLAVREGDVCDTMGNDDLDFDFLVKHKDKSVMLVSLGGWWQPFTRLSFNQNIDIEKLFKNPLLHRCFDHLNHYTIVIDDVYIIRHKTSLYSDIHKTMVDKNYDGAFLFLRNIIGV